MQTKKAFGARAAAPAVYATTARDSRPCWYERDILYPLLLRGSLVLYTPQEPAAAVGFNLPPVAHDLPVPLYTEFGVLKNKRVLRCVTQRQKTLSEF